MKIFIRQQVSKYRKEEHIFFSFLHTCLLQKKNGNAIFKPKTQPDWIDHIEHVMLTSGSPKLTCIPSHDLLCTLIRASFILPSIKGLL